ncbi:related to NOC3 protein, required for maturation and intranuclear transport of pre-ribosomes [Cephalotrichum gorgonifer]|uniref:Nucleolar complex-associated protein 3 n=1 Tax=Cephalotrichum gorgonifer TaxID=2041049 RepID=A0AAE8MYC1_9PEZI|nr:related to NOC3 protein, required for maturation and intranuclear transport of pre-ribosomes [Cephalotrichum gorgonifer]
MAPSVSRKRKLGQAQNGGSSKPNAAKLEKDFINHAAGWELESGYEKRFSKKQKNKKESTRLPIKTADGRVEQVEVEEAEEEEEEVAPAEGEGDWADEAERAEIRARNAAEKAARLEKKKKQSQKPDAERILEAQEELASIANSLNQDPEEHPGAFKELARIGDNSLLAIRKLALVTQMTVYKDVIPGYRIRPLGADAAEEKLSKDVRKLRQYEQSLLAGYQAYIRYLSGLARSQPHPGDRGPRSMSSLAVTCACTLLNAVPHFNFRSDLIKIVVTRLSRRRVDADFVKCQKALETLFAEDEEGRPSLEAVSTLCKMMKAKSFGVDERVINLFLHLRLLSEFSGKASQDHAEVTGPKKAAPKVFRTKRERKAIKEQKAVDKVMEETDALVRHEEREKMQSETLKLVFATYFRILKFRLPHLMGAVLEGLAKYAHLINQDFFGDLLEALKDLISQADADADQEDGDEQERQEGEGDEDEDDEASVRNTTREALLCTITAFALLAGQDVHNSRNDLHLDLAFFNNNLYKSLLALSTHPDLELTSKSHLPDPSTPAPPSNPAGKVNLQTTTVLLIRSLTYVLLPPWNIRSVPPTRLAAFSKQLMTSALHTPEKSTRAILALLSDVADAHGKKISGLWNTDHRVGNGVFNPLATSFDGANPFAATIWEGEILRKHFSPLVREGVKAVEKGMNAQ